MSFQVWIGDHNIKISNETVLPESRLAVASYKIHESFDWRTFEADICIIRLARDVNIDIYTPVCLARTFDRGRFSGRFAWAYGESNRDTRNYPVPRIGIH